MKILRDKIQNLMEKNNKKFIMPSKLNDNVTEIVILKKIKKKEENWFSLHFLWGGSFKDSYISILGS